MAATREPWNEPSASKSADLTTPDDLGLLDDDFDQASANTDPLARSAAARAYGVQDADGDDALPVF